MNLKEAHEMAEDFRTGWQYMAYRPDIETAMVILDDRVAELEADIKTAGIQNSALCERLQEAEARIQELEDALKEQVEIAYRAGVEDGWTNPDGNIENMTYEYMKYQEAKLWRETQRAKK